MEGKIRVFRRENRTEIRVFAMERKTGRREEAKTFFFFFFLALCFWDT